MKWFFHNLSIQPKKILGKNGMTLGISKTQNLLWHVMYTTFYNVLKCIYVFMKLIYVN